MTQWNNLLSSPLKWELLFGWFSNEHFLSIIYRQQTAFPNIFTECLNKHANKTKINRKGEQWWHATWLGVVIFYTSLSLTRWAGCRQEAGYGSSEFFTAGSPLDIMGGTQTALTFAFATPGEINVNWPIRWWTFGDDFEYKNNHFDFIEHSWHSWHHTVCFIAMIAYYRQTHLAW